MNYELDIEIDHDSLDVEWLNQASLAAKYGKNWAECYRSLQLAEEEIKLVRSELIKKANEDPDKCLGEGVKPTGPNIESYYRNHKRHIEAKNEWIECQYQLNIAEIAKKEISYTRKLALENLVKLHGMEYFAGPCVPRDLGTARAVKEAQIKESNTKVKIKRKKKKDGNS